MRKVELENRHSSVPEKCGIADARFSGKKCMYKAVLKNLIMPLIDVKSQTSHVRCLNFLEKSQWLSPDELQALQNKKLRALLKHAYETVSFYRKRFKEAHIRPETLRNVKDIARLPILTKEEVRKNLPNLVSSAVPTRRLTLFATGGSTAEPVKFYKDRRTTSWAYAATSRSYRWAGLDLGDKYMILWGSPFDLSVSKRVAGFLHSQFMRYQLLPSSYMSDQDMANFVTAIRRYKPKALKGYASALVLFARYMKEHQVRNLNLHSVISTAENLYPADRKLIEEQFDCDVYDTYGSREFAMMAAECKEHHGLHVSAETVVLEFARDGENVAAGELGEILVTDLENYGMPMIRYAIGDAGRPTDEVCSCGRGLPLMKSIDGRVTDFARAVDGRYVPGPDLLFFFLGIHAKKYQIIQKQYEKVIVRIVKDTDYSDLDEKRFVTGIKQTLGNTVEVATEYVNQIPSSSRSGKFLSVICEIPLSEPPPSRKTAP